LGQHVPVDICIYTNLIMSRINMDNYHLKKGIIHVISESKKVLEHHTKRCIEIIPKNALD
jgi:hypothetical protein